jgi:hypothetical protein
MRVVYVDETGDTGADLAGGASRGYGLGIITLPAIDWENAANRGLHPGTRRSIYKRHLKLIEKLGISAFAVWLDKEIYIAKDQMDTLQEDAWVYMFQRLTNTFPNEPLLLIHDEGDNDWVRKITRKSSVFLNSGSVFGSDSIKLKPVKIIDDAVPRHSDQNYFLQFVDLVAFAASKAMLPGGSKVKRVCPESMWDSLGTSKLSVVNHLARRRKPELPEGIVTRK